MTSHQSLARQSYLCESGALDVFHGSQFLGEFLSHLYGDGTLSVLGEFFDSWVVIAQIDLSSNQQERRLLTVVRDLGHPLQNKYEMYA